MTENTQGIGVTVLRHDWEPYSEKTRQILEQVLERYGEEAAFLCTEAVSWEVTLRGCADKQHIERLQTQVDDTRTVLHLRERELARLKATKGRKHIQAIEQRCRELEEALARKPADEASEKAALIDAFMREGQDSGFPRLFSTDGVLVEAGVEAYCAFFSCVTSEELEMAREALRLHNHAKAGREKLKMLSSSS